MLERIQTTLIGIKQLLLNDEEIRKLIYNDSNNALNIEVPTIQQVENYITLRPIYQFENCPTYEQNGMINIYFAEGEPQEDEKSMYGIIRVNVVFNIDKWELLDNKIRTIELSDRIIKLLDNKKLTISNPLKFSSITELIINKHLVGYALMFDLVDGDGEINNY